MSLAPTNLLAIDSIVSTHQTDHRLPSIARIYTRESSHINNLDCLSATDEIFYIGKVHSLSPKRRGINIFANFVKKSNSTV